MCDCYCYCLTYVWATVSALMCLVCPVLLSVYTVLYVLFYEQINGMEWNGMDFSSFLVVD